MKRLLSILLFWFLLAIGVHVHAADSGVTPNVISLPKGPGSVEGLGENFTPAANSGTASYGMAIEVPTGSGGIRPAIRISYEGGKGNSALGFGWSLLLPRIQRQTDQGLPRYAATDTFIYQDGTTSEELVPLADGSYRLKNEGAFIRVTRDGDAWEVRTKSGVIYRLGEDANARVTDVTATKVFAWNVTAIIDPNGNRVTFEWSRSAAQSYLASIRYNDFDPSTRCEVLFAYESRNDALADYRAGFAVVTEKRLQTIAVERGGELVRAYRFTYDAASSLSRLARVTLVGSDNATTLPPLTFGYTHFSPQTQQVQAMENAPGKGLMEKGNALVDLNGDALPDLIVTAPGDHSYYLNRDGMSWDTAADMASSPSYALSQDGVKLADIDGNGIADLVAARSGTGNVYLPGTGNASWKASIAFDQNPVGFDLADPNTRLVDLNGDRLIDVLRTAAGNVYAWIHQGSGTFERTGALPKIDPNEQVLFSDPQIQLADVNGDGLLDIARLRSGSVVYWPSMGYGRFDAARSLSGVPLVADETRLHLTDLNGDGLADIVYLGVNEVDYWLSAGDGSFAAEQTITNVPSANPLTTKVEFADMNGNGTTDIVWVDVSHGPDGSWQYLDVVGDQYSGLLTRIENSLGKLVRVDYESSTAQMVRAAIDGKPWSRTLPFPTVVIKQVTVEDGIGPTMVTEYTYRDGFYDGAVREFRGFAQGLLAEPGDATIAGLITDTTFDVGQTDESLKGKPLLEEKKTTDGALITRVQNAWQVMKLADGLDGRKVAFAALVSSVTTIAEENNTPKYTRQDLAYDTYGNVIESRSHGLVKSAADDGTIAVGNDEVFTSRTFALNESAWILDRVSREVVRDAQGTVLSDTRSYYDGLPYMGLAADQVDRGNLMRQEQWVKTEDRWVEGARYRRDAWGNITAMLDGAGGRREISYDDESHTYPVRERIFTGSTTLEFTADYDPLVGKIALVTDPNGAKTYYRYDALGRPIAVIKPGDSAELPTEQYRYDLAAPISMVTVQAREVSGAAGTLDTYTFVDGLGRSRVEATEDEGGQFAVTRASVLNVRGKESFVAEPFRCSALDGSCAAFASNGLSGLAGTQLFYDALGRNHKTVNPDGTQSIVEYRPLEQWLFDEEDASAASAHRNTPTIKRTDGQGRLISVAFNDAGRELTTSFSYDAVGNLTAIADPKGNLRTQGYDGLKRMVWLEDPNAGRREFQYDDAGNLVEKRKPGEEVVRYRYEPTTHRLLAKNEVTGTDDESWEVVYHYDEPSADVAVADNALKGRLSWVEDAAGKEYFAYDARGRRTLKRRVIADKTFDLGFGYDALDRQVLTRTPDGAEVTTGFNARGLTASVGSYLTSRVFNAAGQVVDERLGTGVTKSFAYDARRRVTEQQITNNAGEVIQSFFYSFDAVGNIQQIQDQRPVAEDRRDTQSFAYDDLYRLTKSDYAAGNLAWAYDDVGNIVSRTTTLGDARLQAATMRYGEEGAGPYALTSADDVRYAYDRNGRLTSLPHRTLTWDAEDRLTTVTKDDGTTVSMVYGHDGNRVIKRVCSAESEPAAVIASGTKQSPGTGCVETLYVDPTYEVRADKATKYIWADGKRIARVETLAAESGASLALMGKGGVLHPVRPERVEGRTLPGDEGIPPIVPVAFLSFLAPLPVIRNRKRAVALFLALSMAFCTWGGAVTGCGGAGPASLNTSASSQQGVVYYLTDHLGSANLVTDSNGTVLREEQRYPYGLDRKTEGTAKADYVYTGKELDEETGLIYFGARYYAPELGRWASPDPLFVEGATNLLTRPREQNLYTYSTNNPLTYVDPNGEIPVAAFIPLAMLAGGVVGMVGRGVSDISKGKMSDWEDYAGSFTGGAAGVGVGFVSVLPAGLAGAVIGGGVGGAVGNATTQVLKHVTQGKEISTSELAADTVVGASLGLIPGLGGAKTALMKTSSSVYKGLVTNIKQGRIHNVYAIKNALLGQTLGESILPTIGGITYDGAKGLMSSEKGMIGTSDMLDDLSDSIATPAGRCNVQIGGAIQGADGEWQQLDLSE